MERPSAISENSAVAKAHQITQDNAKGVKYVNFKNLAFFVLCFGVHIIENILSIEEYSLITLNELFEWSLLVLILAIGSDSKFSLLDIFHDALCL